MTLKYTFLSLGLILIIYPVLNGISMAQEDLPPQVPVTATPANTNAEQPARLTGLSDRLEPLLESVIASCPVSLPNLSESPDEHYIDAETGYGNPERTLFIGLWPGGKVIFHPVGAGSLSGDGSLSMKFWFYRTVPGEVVIEGRRLDEPEVVARLATLRGPADGYGETGFHPAGLHFPGQGCWEVTSSVGDDRMVFVTLVLWIPFEPLWPISLPEGATFSDTDLAGYPHTIEHVFEYPDGGKLTVGTTAGVWDDSKSYPDSDQHQLTLHGQAATCVRGAWAGQVWNSEADAAVLMWSDEELSYRISQEGLYLTCQDLLQIPSVPEKVE